MKFTYKYIWIWIFRWQFEMKIHIILFHLFDSYRILFSLIIYLFVKLYKFVFPLFNWLVVHKLNEWNKNNNWSKVDKQHGNETYIHNILHYIYTHNTNHNNIHRINENKIAVFLSTWTSNHPECTKYINIICYINIFFFFDFLEIASYDVEVECVQQHKENKLEHQGKMK
jgi:hypothetical protein